MKTYLDRYSAKQSKFISNLMLLLVLLQVCDTLCIFSLLLMTNQVVFGQGEIITHFLQLLCKLVVFHQ